MGLWSRVKEKVKSVYGSVDKAVGGYLPGGSSPSGSTSSSSGSSGSSPSGSTSSSSGSSGSSPSGSTSSSSGSSGSSPSGSRLSPTLNQVLFPKGTYDVLTNTYTSPEGNKQCMTLSTAQSIGAIVTFGDPTSTKSISPYSGGSSRGSSPSGSRLSPSINISTSTSSNQPATPQPKAVIAYNPLDYAKRPYDPYGDMSFKEKTGSVISEFTSKSFWKDVGSDFSYTPFTGIKTLLSPLQVYSRSKVGDIKAPDLPYQGTLIFDPNSGNFELPEQYKGKTGWEKMQRDAQDAELAKYIAEKATINELTQKYQNLLNKKAQGYQAQINTGSLTANQAESKLKIDYAKLQEDYLVEAKTVYINKLNSDPLYKDWGKEFNRYNKFTYNVPQIVLTGGLVSASLAGGIPAIVASGSVGVEGAFTTGRGVQEKDYIKAGIGATMFALGTYGAVRGTANYMTQQNIKEVLSIEPKEVYSVRVANGDYSYDLFRSIQQTDKAYAYTSGGVISKIEQANQFQIMGGQSNTIVYTKDIWSGKGIFVGGSQTINPTVGYLFPSLAKDGWTPSAFRLSTTTHYDYSLIVNKVGSIEGSGNFYPSGTGKTINDLYGGLAKQFGDKVLSFSGKIDSSGFNYIELGKNAYAIDTTSLGYSFGVENIGVTKIIDPSKLSHIIYFNPTPSNLGYPPSGFSAGGSSGGSVIVNALQSQTPVLAPSLAKSISSFSSSVQATGGAGVLVATAYRTASPAKSKAETSTLIAPTLNQMLNQRTSQIQVATDIPVVKPKSLQVVQLANIFTQIQLPKMMYKLDKIQIQKPGLVNPLTFATPGMGTPKFGYDFNIPPFLLDLPSGMDVGGLKKHRVKIKKVVKYTPSYSAVILNIRGKAPKGIETGLRVRPITKGTDNLLNLFSGKKLEFYNPFQMLKIKKRRIIKRKVKRR